MCTVAESNETADVAEAYSRVVRLAEAIGTDVITQDALEKKGKAVDGEGVRPHFLNTITMLACVEECLGRDSRLKLSDMGLTFELFCQTWDVVTGKPNFSVPSPHFQTCLIVTDREKLLGHMGTVSTSVVGNEHVESFETLSRMLGLKMSEYEKKFVRVSGMASAV
jgi:hypothetical protein